MWGCFFSPIFLPHLHHVTAHVKDGVCSWYSHNHTCSSLQGGYSSLMRASRNGHEGVVMMLLSTGAKVDVQDEVSGTNPWTCGA